MTCHKCTQRINCRTDVFVVCSGSCVHSFHGACVGLSDVVVNSIKKNVIWLCDECLSDFDDYQQKKFTTLPEDDTPRKLFEEMANMEAKIANIETLLSAMSGVRNHSEQSLQSTPPHSTPLRHTKLHDGSRIDTSRISHECSSQLQHSSNSSSSIRQGEGTFSLFLTNIDGRVTEEEISIMVSESLHVGENQSFRVKKLVPKWMPDYSLDYASFKVTVEEKYKLVMLREDTWPTGIKYREFIERPRNTWKPRR